VIGRVLLVGDELLGGTIADRNARVVAAALADAGIAVDRVETVGDDPPAISAALERLVDGAGVVVTTGGLGPTLDDVTRDGVALRLGVPLEEDAEAVRRLRERLAERGIDPSGTVLRQALFPRGATRVDNPVGSAPGFRVRIGDCDLWSLPGVPHEAEVMVAAVVAAVGRAGVAWQRTVATAGKGEVLVAERIEAARFRPPAGARLAYLPGPGGVRVRVFSPGGMPAAELDGAERELRDILGAWALPEPGLPESVVRVARERGERLATAESCTGGLIGARITDVPGSSAVYLGGVVAYSDEVKAGQLGVDRELLQEYGAVSEPVARALAEGVRERFGASLALSVTGIAGPTGGTPEKPVGTVWIGLAGREGTLAERFRFPGPREFVRQRTVNKALEIAYRRMAEAGSPETGSAGRRP
jgi:nicotinamide-nucleotide amidase